MSLFTLFVALAATATTASAADSWTINHITSHFVNDNSGLPGGSWPPGTEFDSTLAFNISLTHDAAASGGATLSELDCTTNWAPRTNPTSDWHTCTVSATDAGAVADGNALQWQFADGQYTNGGRFALAFQYTQDFNATHKQVTTSNFATTNNDFSSDIDYLTCLSGAPLTGVTCNTDGQMSTKRTPIPLTLASTYVAL